MAIRYIHNDPGSVPYLESVLPPRAGRTGAVAKFAVDNLAAEQVYPVDAVEFVDWQCRDAAIRAIEAWEHISGALRFWYNDQRAIALIPRRAMGLGGSYERSLIGFDQWPVATSTFFVGASTDAVSHEVGHAVLDARRPTFWNSVFSEVAAFHEGFADCMSLLVALFDDQVVAALFATAAQPVDVLKTDGVVSQVAEGVAAATKTAFGDQHPASQPRRLKNDLQWAIPTTLPPNPTPTNLSREPHSFGRVFTGCFYDCIDNIYVNSGPHDAQGLRSAALTAGRLLATAIDTAPEEIRFFRSVGRAMIHADAQQNADKNHLPVRDAFAAHNVALGSSAQLAPTMALAGPSPPLSGPAALRLSARTRSDLIRRVRAPRGVRVSASRTKMGGKSIVRARLGQRLKMAVDTGKRLFGNVIVGIHEEMLLGSERKRCVVLGDLPNRVATEEEVHSFVESLSDSGALHPDLATSRRTHTLRKRGPRRVLRRIRFACTCHR